MGILEDVVPVADRPVVTHRADRGDLLGARGTHRWRRGQDVLGVNDFDVMGSNEITEKASQPDAQAFVPEIVAHERNARSKRRESDDVEPIIGSRYRIALGMRLDDDDPVTSRPQALRQLVRAPSAAT